MIDRAQMQALRAQAAALLASARELIDYVDTEGSEGWLHDELLGALQGHEMGTPAAIDRVLGEMLDEMPSPRVTLALDRERELAEQLAAASARLAGVPGVHSSQGHA